MEGNKVKKSNEYYLKEAPVNKAIRHLSVPMMLGMSVGSLYTLLNAYFIGLLHNTAMLTAITLGLPLFIILMAVGNLYGVGGGTFITRLIAKGQDTEAKQVASHVVYASVIMGLVIGVLAVIFINPILTILGTTADTVMYTRVYTITTFLTGFTIVLNFTLEQVVRAEGASKVSMNGMIISALVSLALDPLLILGLNLHVMGAALGVAVANLVSAVYYIYYLQKRSEHLRGFFKSWRLSWAKQWEIYKVGTAELFQAAFMIVTTLLLNHYALSYGESVVAGFGVALRIVQLPEFLAMGIFLGCMPLIAYSLASGNMKRFRTTFKHALIAIITIGVLFLSSVYVFRAPIMHLFTQDPAVFDIGTYIIVAMLVSALFNGVAGLLMTIFQAAGEGVPTTVLAVLQGVLFIPILFVSHHYFGLHGIVWAMTITETITCLVGLLFYMKFSKKLKRNEKNKMLIENEVAL
ncbi:putative Na+-driven multidrug efflux pump [Brochothrix thermosphacta]|uniref:Multidrug export protein MepA n=1 Tax=Brochothrix thermosphacta TaxID=2756 RepID=A0A2X0QAZ2_BROTH|nr:putative Na+-driven multidrug efflux pump [Brochothrix thermosphacta]